MLYFCNVIVLDAISETADEALRQQAKEFLKRIIRTNYLNRERIDFSNDSYVRSLFSVDYELTEFANYFFHACKTFTISHEIGHHVLGYTAGMEKKVFSYAGRSVESYVDGKGLATGIRGR